MWQYRQSISIIQQLVSNRMFPLTLKGLEDAIRMLSKHTNIRALHRRTLNYLHSHRSSMDRTLPS